MAYVIRLLVVWSFFAYLIPNGTTAEPLHVRIDRIIDAAQIGPQASPATDAQFLRRAYLDLTGVIPTSAEARAFPDDKSPDKRQKLIERLLGSPRYVRHLAESFHLTLMERRSNATDWMAFLRTSIEQNKPWNEIAADILGSDGVDPKKRGPINFYLARNVEPNLMTRDVGRIFFGMDVECAQCHDHPRISDYFQRDYYGIYAFLNRTYLFKPDKKKPAVLAEKAEGDVKYKSVFTEKAGATRPRLPGGEEIAEPTFKKGEEYKVKPDKKNKKLRPVPKFSRREQLAHLVRKGENRAFRRNIANRLWAHVMGRGIVHPPDLIHSENPPSHPELLDLLADELAAIEFDIKAFLRELMLTKAYQRSVSLPDNLPEHAKRMAPRLAALQAEEKKLEARDTAVTKSIRQTTEQQEKVAEALENLAKELAKITASTAATKKAIAPLAKASTDAKRQLQDRQMLVKLLTESQTQLTAALKLQPKDKSLIELQSKLTAILKLRSDEITALMKTAAQKEQALKPVADKLAGEEKQLGAHQAKRDQMQKQLQGLLKQLVDYQSQASQSAMALGVTQKRIGAVEALLKYAQQMVIAQASEQAAQKALGEIKPIEVELEKTLAALAQHKAKTSGEDSLAGVSHRLAQAQEMVNQASQSLAALQKRLSALVEKARPVLDQARKDEEALHEAYEELTQQWSEQFVIGYLEPLTPEQMAWSVMQATGLLARQQAASQAELNKKKPLKPEELKDPAKVAARAKELEDAIYAKLKGNVATFVKLYGIGAGQPQYDFFATAEQAMFFANSSQVQGWLAPSGGNLSDRLMKIAEPEKLAEELYLSVLTRRPTAQEVGDVKEYLAALPKEKITVVKEMIWALLTSSEFRFQH